MPQECDFFLEIFEFRNFSFEEGIIVQGLKPPRKVKAGLAPIKTQFFCGKASDICIIILTVNSKVFLDARHRHKAINLSIFDLETRKLDTLPIDLVQTVIISVLSSGAKDLRRVHYLSGIRPWLTAKGLNSAYLKET